MKDRNYFHNICNINQKKYTFLKIFICFCFISISNCLLIGNLPYIKKLNDNKYIAISQKGIAFLDPTLTYSSKEISFDVYGNNGNLARSTLVVQFSQEDDNLIIALINANLYIFNSNLDLLNNQTIIFDYYTNPNAYRPYYLFPYKKLNNTYEICLLDVNDYDEKISSSFLSLQKIIYDYDNNTISLNKKINYTLEIKPDNINQVALFGSIGCSLVNYNNSKSISCIYGIFDSFKIINFDPNNNFVENILINESSYRYPARSIFKAIPLPGNEKVVYCTFYSESGFDCIIYDIINNNYTLFINFSFNLVLAETTCYVEYFEESEQLVFSLNGQHYVWYNDYDMDVFYELYIYICDLNGNCTEKKYENEIENIPLNRISIRTNLLIPKDKLTYHLLIFNEDTDNYDIIDLGFKFNLKCKNYYNYLKTSCLDEIPEGYFCNSTEDKTIDKCHDNCKTCNKSSTENNNNCLTCKDNDTIFYDLGNCRSNCINGFFNDDIHNLTCKCANNIECLLCNENNLCKICNKEKGYYQKNDEEIINDYVNCYKDPEGYYLLNDKYYSCYSTCKNCTEQGNSDDNKCTECKEGYKFRYDFENDTNCYYICEYYYYFDENKKYHCTNTSDCPPGYNKLIENKACIKEINNIQKTTETFIENLINFTESKIDKNKENLNNNTECKIKDYLNNKCNISNDNDNIIDQIKNSIKNNELNELLNEIINNQGDYTQKIDEITIQLISLENQDINKKRNISIIDFGGCEEILRSHYGLENSSILLYKIDIPISGYSTMIVEYELYNTNNYSNILNLDYCNKSSINIHIPVIINENEAIKYDPSGEFYNDICSPYTNENGADVILLDRKNEFINNNLTLCDEDCQFKEYDSINKKAICKCKIKNVMDVISNVKKIDSEKFFKDWINIENIINISVLKCIKLFKTKTEFLKNIGNFLLLSVILLFIASANYFYFKGFSKLTSEINQLQKDVKFDLKRQSAKQLSVFQTNKNDILVIPKNKKKKRNTAFKRKSKKSTININNENKNSKNLTKNLIICQNSTNNIINKENNLNVVTSKQENKKGTKLNDYELNSLTYKDALELDKRTCLEYYWSLIKTKQLLIFTFYFTKDYNSYIIKIELFLFSISLYLTISALFFTDNTIHKIYEDKGIFNFLYNIPQILYSTIISAVINAIVKALSLTESKILEIKMIKSTKKLKEKAKEIIKCLKLKFILFYIISGLFLIIFWLYISCFCAVYRNTQYHLIKDTMLSFLLSLLYPFFINIIPIFIRIPAIRNKNQEYLYKISKIVQLI